jgi:DHA2 family multidrug resistance protein
MRRALIAAIITILVARQSRCGAGWTPDVSQGELITGIVIQGAGLGLVFTPLQLVAFTTLAPSLRTEGTSLFALVTTSGRRSGCR